MSNWSQIFLGVIAVSTLLMAMVQIAAVVYGLVLARRIAQLVARLEQDMGTILSNLDKMARDAARASALAASQAERVDGLFLDLTSRIQNTAAALEQAVIRPLRDAAAVIAGVRTAVAVVKSILKRPDSAEKPPDEPDSL